ncbi:hypothetical protein [Streptomyces sp. NPDC055506]
MRRAGTSAATAVVSCAVRSATPPATAGHSATFWVYSPADREATLQVDTLGGSGAQLAVNGHDVLCLAKDRSHAAVSPSGGVNKVTATGGGPATTLVDRLTVTPTEGTLPARIYEAGDATLAGSTTLAPLFLATDGAAITDNRRGPQRQHRGVHRDGRAGRSVRAEHPLLQPRTLRGHALQPRLLARHADISVNGGAARRLPA